VQEASKAVDLPYCDRRSETNLRSGFDSPPGRHNPANAPSGFTPTQSEVCIPCWSERWDYLGREQFHLLDVVVHRIEQKVLRSCPDQFSQFIHHLRAAAEN
jgi:hypothetical protein